jgi:hypothetical protein
MKKKITLLIKDDRGAISALTVILMVAFVGILALVIDLGHLHTVQGELRNAADAAALAEAAKDTSLVNQADLKNITLDPEEIFTGVWDFKPVGTKAGTFTPTACSSDTNAVKVTARMRSDLSQGSVMMTFARIFGIDTVNPSATAIAVVGYLNTVEAGTPYAGWLAANKDYLDKLWNEYFYDYWVIQKNDPSAPYTGTNYYFVIQPAMGSADWQTADNAGWSLPQGNPGGDNPTPTTVIPIIDGSGTIQVDMTSGSTVANLANGETSPIIKAIQDQVIANNGSFEMLLACVSTESFNHPETVNTFYNIAITGAWKAGESKDLPEDFLTSNGILDPKQFVGVIQFHITGPVSLPGAPGTPPKSNTYSLMPKLVQ